MITGVVSDIFLKVWTILHTAYGYCYVAKILDICRIFVNIQVAYMKVKFFRLLRSPNGCETELLVSTTGLLWDLWWSFTHQMQWWSLETSNLVLRHFETHFAQIFPCLASRSCMPRSYLESLTYVSCLFLCLEQLYLADFETLMSYEFMIYIFPILYCLT